jgi:hypothetical protein
VTIALELGIVQAALFFRRNLLMKTYEDRVARVRRMLEEGEGEEELISPTFVNRSPWQLALKNGAFARRAGESVAKSLFTDVRVRVEDAIADGDKVVVRWRMRGKWSHGVAEVKPTGREVELGGVNIYHFVGDKIVAQDGEVDLGSFAHQAIGAGVEAAACARAIAQVSRPAEMVGDNQVTWGAGK